MIDYDIVIHCLGMPFDGNTINHGTMGGSESAAYYVALELAKAGHNVTVFTNCEEYSTTDGVKYIPAGPRSDAAPLGASFHYYAENTPHDVLIIQRIPGAFQYKFASKINLLWLHDLALHEQKPELHKALWNITGILCVSEYHKKQVTDVYGIPGDVVHVLRNGVDTEAIFNAPASPLPTNGRQRLFYMSRPERGLEHLVKPGGIMDQCPDADLYFCTYDNVSDQMRPYYEQLWAWAKERGNCINLGALTKPQLYSTMKSMSLLVYPTPADSFPNFREVSCIAMMEARAAGLPVLTTNAGALEETNAHTEGVISEPDIGVFPRHIDSLEGPEAACSRLRELQRDASKGESWADRVNDLLGILSLPARGTSRSAYRKDRLRHSDISRIFTDGGEYPPCDDLIGAAVEQELHECYSFYPLDSYADHYRRYYEYEKDRGVDYGPEDVTKCTRYQTVAQKIADSLDHGGRVLDYGCAHGHYTVSLAKAFPHIEFVGLDICQRNINTAAKWAQDEGLTNVTFVQGEIRPGEETPIPMQGFDAIIMAEVLEHVRDPVDLVNTITALHALPGAKIIITTPFGPWESHGYVQHWPWRAHVHDFTKRAIRAMYGHLRDFDILAVPAAKGADGTPHGSWVYSYTYIDSVVLHHDKSDSHILRHGARQTVSLCMILRDHWASLHTCLESCSGVVDELLIGVDDSTSPTEQERIKYVCELFEYSHKVPVSVFAIPSPLSVGFDNARNAVCEKASGDWILWLDHDEVVNHSLNILKYLRPNCLDAYLIPQHHFSVDPPELLKTDYPAKLFRNRQGVQFFGRVHEHPEYSLNGGLGVPFILHDVAVAHSGYDNEATRRGRFERNFPLLVQDRNDYPTRSLGAFFWLRDMAQSCKFMHERGATYVPEFHQNLQSGLDTWPTVLETRNLRMIMEASQFYKELVIMTGKPSIKVAVRVAFQVWSGGSEMSYDCAFLSKADAAAFQTLVNELILETGPDSYNSGF